MWSWRAAGAAATTGFSAWLSDGSAFAAAKRKAPDTPSRHGEVRQKYSPADLKMACLAVQSGLLGNNQAAKKFGIPPSTLTTKYHSNNWEMGTIGRPGVSPDVIQQLREEIRIRTEQNKHTPVLQSCKRAVEINKELFGPSNPGFRQRITASKSWYRERICGEYDGGTISTKAVDAQEAARASFFCPAPPCPSQAQFNSNRINDHLTVLCLFPRGESTEAAQHLRRTEQTLQRPALH